LGPSQPAYFRSNCHKYFTHRRLFIPKRVRLVSVTGAEQPRRG
jgi:hypothetical protein